jgi:hypothetical protein
MMTIVSILMITFDRGVRRVYDIPRREKPPLEATDISTLVAFDEWLARHHRTPSESLA